MFAAYTSVAVVLALMSAGTANAKIRGMEPAVSGLLAAGVPRSWFVPLALLNLAGATGLLLGIAWRPLGIASALGLTLYFLGALGFHLRAWSFKGMPMAAVFTVLSAATLVLAVTAL
ncbi:DoxX family protein [Kineosporia babensis]|uniref:DoxX family protein n=1 Tax=Kineosporia babensis TaxID=499548 RepID=A0A9X1ND78_9ACTN|nr:DoxX family protein [Kineosporia babensis]MCD5311106.1 DoxX family protein [Kineosporia babensis]